MAPPRSSIRVVQRRPVRRREVVARVVRERRPGREADDGLSTAPGGGALGVAGHRVDEGPVAGQAAGRPDAAARGDRVPALHLRGVGHRDAHDPPVVRVAVTVVPSIGDIEDAVDELEGAPLVLVEGAEARHRGRHVDRPARAGDAGVERDAVNQVLHRLAVGRRGRVEVDGSRRGVDDRRPRDAQRADVAAGEDAALAAGNRRAEALVPYDLAGAVDRGHVVGLGRHDEGLVATWPVLDVERLRPDVADDLPHERGAHVRRRRGRLGEDGVGVQAVAARVLVMLVHGGGGHRSRIGSAVRRASAPTAHRASAAPTSTASVSGVSRRCVAWTRAASTPAGPLEHRAHARRRQEPEPSDGRSAAAHEGTAFLRRSSVRARAHALSARTGAAPSAARGC